MISTDSQLSFEVEASEEGEGTRFLVSASDGRTRRYHVNGGEHPHYLQFYTELAEDFGTRPPGSIEAPLAEPGDIPWTPLLVDNIASNIHYGYGDPAVLKVDDGWLRLPERPGIGFEAQNALYSLMKRIA